jgi:uncharacterized protein (TIGR00255 family)
VAAAAAGGERKGPDRVIRSMTGFGDASREVDSVHYSVEMRSLNNKFFKATIRLPDELEGLEAEIDSRLRRRLTRGSIVVKVSLSDRGASAAYDINLEALQTYVERLGLLPHEAGHTVPIDVSSLLNLPGVLQAPAHLEERLEAARPIVHALIDQACDRLVEMRDREGAMLHADLHSHHRAIQERLDRISGRCPLVVEEYNERLRSRIEIMLADAQIAIEDRDLVREVAIYAERSDTAEEVSRLKAHLAQFVELIDGDGGAPIGRTLDFLAQELLREANTIASKSGDAQISRDIVEIKGAIDRIKEQVQNIE